MIARLRKWTLTKHHDIGANILGIGVIFSMLKRTFIGQPYTHPAR